MRACFLLAAFLATVSGNPLSVPPASKVLPVDDAEQQHLSASERLNNAWKKAGEANHQAITKSAAAVGPVVQDEIQKLFPSPSPPPPPFTGQAFGLAMFDSMVEGDTKHGTKTLAGGAEYGFSLADPYFDGASDRYQPAAQAAKTAVHLVHDKPPPPPSVDVLVAEREEAVQEAKSANDELYDATKAAVHSKFQLVHSQLASAVGQGPESDEDEDEEGLESEDLESLVASRLQHAEPANRAPDHTRGHSPLVFAALGCAVIAVAIGASTLVRRKSSSLESGGVVQTSPPSTMMV